MQIHYDPDEFELVFSHSTCAFHEINPGEPFAGCTCSGGYTQRRREASEVAAIKAKRQRTAEDRILAQAELIRAQRKS